MVGRELWNRAAHGQDEKVMCEVAGGGGGMNVGGVGLGKGRYGGFEEVKMEPRPGMERS